jgi:hypothetical protein
VALTRNARITLKAGAVVAVLAFLMIVEFGISAGRIHYGVEVRGGLEIGGMTPSEADEVLEERAQEMLADDIVLGGPGVTVRFYPQKPDGVTGDVLTAGWAPGRPATIEAALAVGRKDAPFGALADRWKAWVSGVKIAWKGHPLPRRIKQIIDTVEELGEEQGLTLDRVALRVKIRRVLNTWPRRDVYRIPFTTGA